MKPLESSDLGTLVATFRAAIVATIEPASDALACSIVKVSRAKVITIEPSADVLSLEEAVRLFCMAFE